MKKVGFIFGGKYGSGFAICMRPRNIGWSAPAAMRVEGGSVGFQIGASETDVVLLVMNDGGMRHLLSDKFTIGGDGCDDERGNAVVFAGARFVRRHFARRRDAASG